MKQLHKICISSLLIMSICFSQTMTEWIINVEVPENTPSDANIFVAGNFNEWNPADSAYKLIRSTSGGYTITVNTNLDNVEFKFTMGSWNLVETLADGINRDNRSEKLKKEFIHKNYRIAAWADPYRQHDIFASIVGKIDTLTNFLMPQLNRTRRIWIYLPPGYETSSEPYPVLYMHDGQNCFSETTAFDGEWGVDETMENLIKKNKINKMIVVAIDNSPIFRLNEYTPYAFDYMTEHYDAQGSEYAEFIVKTLKPYIDSHYRTKPSREYTGIIGSSMGGLISLYIGLEYQNTFSKVGALSSSFGLCLDEMLVLIESRGKQYPMNYWLDVGSKEKAHMDRNIYQIPIYHALLDAGWKKRKEVTFRTIHGGEHNEISWRERFGDVVRYLYK
ncbi:MAG: hypothetical protein KAT14_03570 [Candidatus Marinimicrobia bacterium]|nr:hypothetical protein [Candidatus Neomarinimicrobiota bacterium]